jgi:HAMP domain-containing protein
MTRWRVGVQLEIVANLFVMMFAGVALVGVVLLSHSALTVRDDAIERLHMGSRHLESLLERGVNGLDDLAAVARTSTPRVAGGEFAVLDASGRPVLSESLGPEARRQIAELVDLANAQGEVLEMGSLWRGELALVTPVRTRSGQKGFLVGRSDGAEYRARLAPLVASAAWLLVIATSVFAGFGAWLLRGRVVSPLAELAQGTQRVAAGDLATRIRAQGPAELEELAASFNRMAESLEADRAALERAQEALARGRRLASVGQLAAGVAHEVGNPVAAILGYAEMCQRDKGGSELASWPNTWRRRPCGSARWCARCSICRARTPWRSNACPPGSCCSGWPSACARSRCSRASSSRSLWTRSCPTWRSTAAGSSRSS